MLISIPVISPIEVPLTAEYAQRLLPPPQSQIVDADYTIHDDVSVTEDTAGHALDEIEQAAYVKEYHDSEWWRERLQIVRKRLAEEP
jgi:hypothetical protein